MTQIAANNTRRFRLLGGFPAILAIAGAEGRTVLYAEVGADAAGNLVFTSEPRHYWADEFEEIL
jgi:hypothetical protein